MVAGRQTLIVSLLLRMRRLRRRPVVHTVLIFSRLGRIYRARVSRGRGVRIRGGLFHLSNIVLHIVWKLMHASAISMRIDIRSLSATYRLGVG
jgi:hypothetical protein